MSKNQKYKFFANAGDTNPVEVMQRCRQTYISKYYNLFMSRYIWKGLDDEVASQQENYIMRKMWSNGTLAAFDIKNAGALGFTTYAVNTYNMYDFPETVNLIDTRGVGFIPQTPQIVGKDVAIGWCQPNHKPISAAVEYYVDRMVAVDMVINTNLQLQKMPWLVAVDEADQQKMQDIVRRILSNEVVVFTDLESLSKVQTLATNTPFIIDKLSEYRDNIEKDLLTYLGIDNDGGVTKTHMTADTANATNNEINEGAASMRDELTKWLDSVNRLFGRHITIEERVANVASNSIHDAEKDVTMEENRND